MTATRVKHLSLTGSIRLVPGRYNVVWKIGLEDDAHGLEDQVLNLELTAPQSQKKLELEWDMSKVFRLRIRIRTLYDPYTDPYTDPYLSWNGSCPRCSEAS